TAPGGISRLSAWWVRLGILPERSRPARPADNGRHERMHRTLKAEATLPPQANCAAQQRGFNLFRKEYNDVRPHEALGYQPPSQHYTRSPRPYPRRLPELEYPNDHDRRRVDPSGHIKWRGRPVFLTGALAGETVGIAPADDENSAVYFGPVLLGLLSARRPELGLIRVRAQ